MPRRPSQRELTESLLACVESDGDDDEELRRLLVVHEADLADALRCAPCALSVLPRLAPLERRTRVRTLLRSSRERRQQAQASVVQNASLAAVAMLAKLAEWSDARVLLDRRIVLGAGLLGDRSRTFIRFDAEDLGTVTVRRTKLYEASKALRFSDLTCWLEANRLYFGWRGGLGGLRLLDQSVASREAETVLTVVLTRPRPKVAERRPVVSTEPRWLADGFSDLSLF